MLRMKKSKTLSLLLVVLFTIASLQIQQFVWAQEETNPQTSSAESLNPVASSESRETTQVETTIDVSVPSSSTTIQEGSYLTEPTIETSSLSEETMLETSSPTFQAIMPLAVSDWMPDPYLRQTVASNLGIDEADLTQADMLNLTSLYLSASTDLDLTGLEYATNLTSLGINGMAHDRITNLNLSPFQSLTDFNLYNVAVDAINLTVAPNIENIYFYDVITSGITVSGHPKLRQINLSQISGVSTMDFANIPALQYLTLHMPTLTNLTLQNLPELNYLYLQDNKLTSFILSDLPKLNTAEFIGNSTITSLTIRNLPLLNTLGLTINSLQQLTMENLPALRNLYINNSSMRSVELANFPVLNYLSVSDNALLTSISVRDMSSLTDLSVSGNSALGTVEVNNLPAILYLNFSNNAFKTFTLDNYPTLTSLYLYDNEITAVNISNMPALNYLDISGNRIRDLRNIQTASLSALANIVAYNQIFDDPPRVTVNQPTDLLALYDPSGALIPWQLPGTAGVNYVLNSPGNVTWLTGGLKSLNANYSATRLSYSAIVRQTVLNPDAEGWTLLDGLTDQVDNIIHNSFTRGDFAFTVSSGVTSVNRDRAVTLNENQRITNLNTGSVYTYTYSYGNGVYSNVRALQEDNYWDLISSDIPKIYIRINADGSEEMKRVDENTAQGFKVETITSVTQNGEIRHKVTLTNVSGIDMVDVEPILHIDTQLNNNDAINIYATGGGGVYMEAGGITLFGEPLEGTSLVYGGQYNTTAKSDFQNETRVHSAWGRNNGDILAENVDSAMYFGPSPIALLADGESISFSYQERIFTQDEPVPPPVNSIQVRYVNEAGDLLDEEFLQGSPGDSFTTTAKSFANYDLLRTEGATSGTFTFEPQVVTYIYGLKAGGNVTVRYVDQDGQPLTPDIILTGQVTNTFATLKKVFPGYTFVRVEGSEQGVFTTEEQLVTYFYQKNTDSVGGDVLVRYLNQDGKPLTADIVIPGGQIGMAFSTEKKSFTGYDFVRVEGPTQGTFTQDPQTVTYYYKAQSVVKTGESHRPIEAGFFVLGLAGMLVLGSYLWRRKQQSSDN